MRLAPIEIESRATVHDAAPPQLPTLGLTGVVSVFTSIVPTVLGKRFWRSAEKVEKATSAHMTRGQIEVRDFSDVRGVVDLLNSITVSQALCSSVPKNGARNAAIVTKAELSANPDALARTTDCFVFPPAQPGLLVLDYDPVGEPLAKGALVQALKEICPAVVDTGVVWWCSSSSFIYDGDIPVQGLRGQRLYLMIRDVGDTERAGEVLFKRLWLGGHGRIEVSSSGQLLLRTLFDKSMFQAARLDFIGGAVCEAPLSQRRGLPISVCGEGWLDTGTALCDLTFAENTRFESMVLEAKAAKKGAADQAQAAWKAARVDEATKRLSATGVNPDDARERIELTLTRALEGELCGDFLIPLADGTHISVGEVLANPQRWDATSTLDPVEPGYDGGRVVGKLFLLGERPCLHSFAHGGKRFALRRQPARLRVVSGSAAKLVKSVAVELSREPDVFVRCDVLVQVVNDGLMQLDKHNLRMLAGHRLGLYSLNKHHEQIPADLPQSVAEMLLSSVRTMTFRPINAVLTLPCATPDGTLLTQPGYHQNHGVYLRENAQLGSITVTSPAPSELISALQTIWRPWSLYQFASPADRGGMLAAILTALSRPVLSTAPGFVFDAPAQSSGKTLAAQAVNALVTGRLGASLVPYAKDQQFDVELNKKLMTLSLFDGSVMQIDNVEGHFHSPTLAAYLTSGRISGRLLGGNRWHEGSARLFVTLTSNNASLSRDLSRRFVRVRIDSGEEVPQARSFAFQPDEAALSSRLDIARAALTLMQGFIEAGMPRIQRDDAGFPEWSRLIRNAVLWIQQQGLDLASGMGPVGDPAASLVATHKC